MEFCEPMPQPLASISCEIPAALRLEFSPQFILFRTSDVLRTDEDYLDSVGTMFRDFLGILATLFFPNFLKAELKNSELALAGSKTKNSAIIANLRQQIRNVTHVLFADSRDLARQNAVRKIVVPTAVAECAKLFP